MVSDSNVVAMFRRGATCEPAAHTMVWGLSNPVDAAAIRCRPLIGQTGITTEPDRKTATIYIRVAPSDSCTETTHSPIRMSELGTFILPAPGKKLPVPRISYTVPHWALKL